MRFRVPDFLATWRRGVWLGLPEGMGALYMHHPSHELGRCCDVWVRLGCLRSLSCCGTLCFLLQEVVKRPWRESCIHSSQSGQSFLIVRCKYISLLIAGGNRNLSLIFEKGILSELTLSCFAFLSITPINFQLEDLFQISWHALVETGLWFSVPKTSIPTHLCEPQIHHDPEQLAISHSQRQIFQNM